MGRGPRGVRRGARPDLDRRRPGGRDGRQLGRPGRGSCASASTSTCPTATIERAIVDGVVARYRREGAPRIDGAVEAVRRIAARPCRSRSPRRPTPRSSTRPSTRPGWRDVFAVVVSSDEVAHGKPAPDVYLEAARRLGRRARALPRRRGFAQRRPGREGGRDDRGPGPERERAAGAGHGGAGRPRPRSTRRPGPGDDRSQRPGSRRRAA